MISSELVHSVRGAAPSEPSGHPSIYRLKLTCFSMMLIVISFLCCVVTVQEALFCSFYALLYVWLLCLLDNLWWMFLLQWFICFNGIVGVHSSKGFYLRRLCPSRTLVHSVGILITQQTPRCWTEGQFMISTNRYVDNLVVIFSWVPKNLLDCAVLRTFQQWFGMSWHLPVLKWMLWSINRSIKIM